MKKQLTYLLYFLKLGILMLMIWLFAALCFPVVNKKEQHLQNVIQQNQVQVNKILYVNNEYSVQGIERVGQRFPPAWELYNSYKEFEQECDLALDTIFNLPNQSFSNRIYTENLKTIRENLNQKLSKLLDSFATSSPVITQKEVDAIKNRLPIFQYAVTTNNQKLIEELNLGQIQLTKITAANLLFSKIGGISDLHQRFQPMYVYSEFQNNRNISISLVLATWVNELFFVDSLKVNQESVSMEFDVAKYLTVFENTDTKTLEIESYLRFPFKDKRMVLKDTFKIYPNYKY